MLNIISKIRYWLCRKLCKDLLFNYDMSLEIDRLIVENEELKERLGCNTSL